MTRSDLFDRLVRLFDVILERARKSPTFRLVLPREALRILDEIEHTTREPEPERDE